MRGQSRRSARSSHLPIPRKALSLNLQVRRKNSKGLPECRTRFCKHDRTDSAMRLSRPRVARPTGTSRARFDPHRDGYHLTKFSVNVLAKLNLVSSVTYPLSDGDAAVGASGGD